MIQLMTVLAVPGAATTNHDGFTELGRWKEMVGFSAWIRSEQATVFYPITEHLTGNVCRFEGVEGGVTARVQRVTQGAKVDTDTAAGTRFWIRRGDGDVIIAVVAESGERKWGNPLIFGGEIFTTRTATGAGIFPAASYVLIKLLRKNGCVAIPSWNGEAAGTLWVFNRDAVFRIEGFEKGQEMRGVKLLEQIRHLKPIVAAK